MRERLLGPLLLWAVGLATLSGCSHCQQCSFVASAPPPSPCDRCGLALAGPAQLGPAAPPPASGLPTAPPPACGLPAPPDNSVFQPAPAASGPQPSLPAPPPPEVPGVSFPSAPPPAGVSAPENSGWAAPPAAPGPAGRPSLDPGVRLSPPELANPGSRQGPEPPRTSAPGPVRDSSPAKPPEPPRVSVPPSVQEERQPAQPLPVDIPLFTLVKPRVANGLKPFPDGVAWLRTHGYRTVLYVHGPGEDDAAVRRQFEKNDLRYLSLDLSPTTLSRAVVDRFSRTVADEQNLPLFICDKDGSLAGALWYLHFRLVDHLSDEKAAAEAARLGFTQDQEENRTMWIAVQNFLKNQKP